MANPQVNIRLDKDAERLLSMIVTTDGGDRADFIRAALATAMSGWLNRKASEVQAQLGTGPVIGAQPVPAAPSVELQEAA